MAKRSWPFSVLFFVISHYIFTGFVILKQERGVKLSTRQLDRYIYIYIYAVGRGSGHILAPRKGDLVPGVRPDYPSSGFVLVFWGFRADRVVRSNSDFATSLRTKMGRFFGPSELGWGRNSEISFKT